jgi:hypothetical protein
MERWEYRVLSLRDGRYTATLNEYGREGWELVSVVADSPDSPTTPNEGRTFPVPRTIGRLEEAAAKLNKLGGGDTAKEPAGPTSSLLWVLRRPLSEE